MLVNNRAAAIYGVGMEQYDRSLASGTRVSRKQEKYDTVALSSQAKSYCLVRKKLRETPDIREERVNDIKERMENGTYHVSTRDLANKMLGARG